MLTVYVDADSCPTNIRSIILKAVMRHNLPSYFVADRPLKDVQKAYQDHTKQLREAARARIEAGDDNLRAIKSRLCMVVVAPGMDSADDWIAEHCTAPAFAITHDIPLADRLVEQGITVLDDRGNTFTKENMAQRLSIRNAMKEFREMGVFAEKHAKVGPKQIKAFSDAFDTLLTSLLKQYG
ncbi:MAG: DUF188 domain-containing protein [Sphaerochaeta sp.]|jgi:hypothetical protein|uniref:YaiI/YqxD family protein n=1 Tax=Sphaerochaeta sp. TaxID=1972642 RepID=UPI002FC85BE0